MRLKVLVCAYACNPFLGSENAVGWNWVHAIAKKHDLWVLTDRMNEQDINRFEGRRTLSETKICFEYVEPRFWYYRHDNPTWKWLANSFMRPTLNIAYLAWQRGAYRKAQELTNRIEFDLVHQLTMVGFRFPGSLWRLGVPFVWGPIGGLENTPWRLLPALGLRGALYYTARNLVNSAHKRWLRRPGKAMAASASGIIAATSWIRREIQCIYGYDSQVICEVTPPHVLRAAPITRRNNEPMRLCWCGEHLPGKALPLTLQALARLPKGLEWRLVVLGDGPESTSWRSLSSSLGLEKRCDWYGRVPCAQAIHLMGQSHVFVISSLKDLTSTVLLEALSQGLPVICPNHCGFPDIVTPECGILLPINTPAAFVSALEGAIRVLYYDETRRYALAKGALSRSKDFGLDNKADAIDKVYSKVVAESRSWHE